jgi:hypothetical protein
MSTPVNPPPQLRIPDEFASNREQFAFFRQINTILFQLWNRTGGSSDEISNQANTFNVNLASQVAQLNERIGSGIPVTIDTTGFTVDTTKQTTDKTEM